jgi:hypothetical protein
MCTANGYELSHTPNAIGDGIVPNTLEKAIAKFCHSGNGVMGSGSGSMTDYISNMTIFYCYNPDL